MIDYPTTFACPSRIEGHSQAISAGLVRTPMEAGNARQRRTHRVLPARISLVFVINQSAYAEWLDWVNANAWDDWVSMKLPGPAASALGVNTTAIAVRFMSDLQADLVPVHRLWYWRVRVEAEHITQPVPEVEVPPPPGPLDPYAANLWGAYGLSRLLATAGPSAIRVRRSSDNAEQDIGFVGSALDTAALLAFTGAGNGFVVTWYDQSGGGNHFTQATAAYQPQIVGTGVYLDELLFDGVDDNFATANSTPAVPTLSAYFAGRTRMGVNSPEVVFIGGGSVRAQMHVQQLGTLRDNTVLLSGAGSAGSTAGTSSIAGVPTTQASTWAAIYDLSQPTTATENKIWLNGTQLSAPGLDTPQTGNFSAGPWRLGGDGTTNNSRLAVSAFLIYTVAHDGATIGPASAAVKPPLRTSNIDNYLTGLWGLYSLQKFRSAYAGACIRVRRSSDNAEADIGFDANNRLNETALLAHCGASSGFVTTFYDQSGGTKHLLQATSSAQPRLVNAGVIERSVNGKVGMYFDAASSQYMAPAANSNATPTLTLFFSGVVPTYSASTRMATSLSNGSNLFTVPGYAFIINEVAVGQSGSAYFSRATTRPTFASGQILAGRADRAGADNNLKAQIFTGGVQLATTSTATLGSVSGNFSAFNWSLGRANTSGSYGYFTGYVTTFALYETALSAANVENVSRVLEGGIAG